MTTTTARKNNLELSAKARLLVAKLRSDGQIKEAEAEGSNANNLDFKRKHEQRMKKTDNMSNLMKDNKIIIGGKSGEQLLDYFNETSEMVDEIEQ